MNVLVFNIKTIPDIDGGQRIYSLQGLDDKSTAKALFHLRKQQTGSDELALFLQRIASISVVYRGMGDDMDSEITVRSLGDENSSEAELISLFFNEIKERTPALVSWNGSDFDLPLIQYRSLKNNIAVPEHWKEMINYDVNDDQEHYVDLQGMLSGFNETLGAPLNHIALMLGYPGNHGLDTAQIWKAFLEGNTKSIRDHGEINVINTYLIYLRMRLIQGEINEDKLLAEYDFLREALNNSAKEHLLSFSETWK